MSSLKADREGPQTYWRSLDQLADTPEFRTFVEREFPSIAEDIDVPASRRSFLKVMGASMALAGMTACRWPTEKILPFGSRDADRVPGEPDRYATACEIAGVGTGLLVTSYDGRPVKIEGNPLHPASRGATDSWSQAAVLDLYDPDRSRRVIERTADGSTHRTWDEFRATALPALDAFRASGGAGLYVLAEATSSPTVARMRAKFEARFPEAVWLEYEPVSRDRALEGARLAFGRPVRTHLALEDAATIAAFDDDFLMHHPAAVANARGWAASRSLDNGVSRVYAVESVHSVTGSNADRRLGVRPSEVGFLVGLLARKLFVDRGLAVPPGAGGDLLATLRSFEGAGDHDAFVEAIADDLAASRGRSVVTVGPSLPPAIHALAHWINAGLDNVGATVRYTEDPAGDRPTHDEAIRRFVADAGSGSVSLAVVLGCNPVAFAPGDLDVAAALGKADLAIHLGLYADETAGACAWHLPRAHFLESWNDVEAYDGTRSVGQPLIAPLWDGKTPAELLALLLDEPRQGAHDLVRETWEGAVSGPFEPGWRRVLHDGMLEGSGWAAIEPAPRTGAWVTEFGMHAGAAGHGPDLEVVFRPDYRVYDGRFANNAWLQELPDPISKIAWDNAALIGPATAARLGLGQDDLVRLRVGDRTLELPTHLQPGQPDGTVAVTLGYGRTAAGAVGDGVGFDTYRLRASGAPWNAECTAEPAGGTYPLASTQDHFAMDAMGAGEIQRRVPTLVRELDVAELGDPHDAGALAYAVEHEGPHLPPDPDLQLWKGFDYDDHKWGMAIDLNACTGCGACTVACQAENNIPVVGKDEVLRGREMHWIRIDRYFVGDAEAPRTVHQPVTCQHCENAPCESVCPVAATIHDAEGLNVMVYNRCIGTRYCSNNCPYKVRRFNWFNNHKETRDGTGVETMVFNPEVTVRARGVMEKCTFCLQRIQAVKIPAKNDRRPIRDGEIATACEQACPTRAITFGNLNDPESRIARKHADPRAYTMLEELNVRPRTRYLARLANRGEGAGDGHGTEGHHES